MLALLYIAAQPLFAQAVSSPQPTATPHVDPLWRHLRRVGVDMCPRSKEHIHNNVRLETLEVAATTNDYVAHCFDDTMNVAYLVHFKNYAPTFNLWPSLPPHPAVVESHADPREPGVANKICHDLDAHYRSQFVASNGALFTVHCERINDPADGPSPVITFSQDVRYTKRP
jgi:hypothetical protein